MSDKIRIYLGGTKYEEEPHCSWITRFVDTLGTDKYRFFDPVVGTARGGEVIARDKREIENSDYVVSYIDRPSFGTIMEIKHAFDKQNIMVMVINPNGKYLKDLWLGYHIHHFFVNVEECAKYIEDTWHTPKIIGG